MERFIDVYVSSSLGPGTIVRAQHAYTKGISTETALHSIVCQSPVRKIAELKAIPCRN